MPYSGEVYVKFIWWDQYLIACLIKSPPTAPGAASEFYKEFDQVDHMITINNFTPPFYFTPSSVNYDTN